MSSPPRRSASGPASPSTTPPLAAATVPVPSLALLERLAPLRPVPEAPDLRAHQADDPVALWEAWEAECGRRCEPPFWAVVWPAALAFLRALADGGVVVRGRSLLDVGCGGAVAALAAARAGAGRVVANDLDPVALYVAGRNAAADGRALETDARDRTAGAPDEPFDLVLAADLFYQRSRAAGLLDGLRAWRRAGSEVLLADAGRPFAPREGLELLGDYDVPAHPWADGATRRRVRLLRLGP